MTKKTMKRPAGSRKMAVPHVKDMPLVKVGRKANGNVGPMLRLPKTSSQNLSLGFTSVWSEKSYGNVKRRSMGKASQDVLADSEPRAYLSMVRKMKGKRRSRGSRI